MEDVCLADLLDGIDVHWTEKDIESFRTRRMDIKQFNLDYKEPSQHIARLNRLAVPIKRYLNGDKDARKFIQDDYITNAILYSEVRYSRGLCVKNHAGVELTLVTFDDFPIQETGSCSIMGGTRKRRKKTFRYKV